MLSCIIAATGGLLFGYDTGITGVRRFAAVPEPRPFICDECGKDFHHPHTLSDHCQREHEAMCRKNHRCHRCGNYYDTAAKLAAHICVMTGFRTVAELIEAEKKKAADAAEEESEDDED